VKTLVLYSSNTPNGHKVTVYLEELKAAYGLDFEVRNIDLSKGTQKQPWFLKLNPNGRIPVLVDQKRDDFVVFESAAILLYLSQHYDKESKFHPKDPDGYSEVLQWIFFTHGGIGPMQGQAHHFHKYAPEEIPYAKRRYHDETKRLYGVLEMRMSDRDWITGSGRGNYGIADMNVLPWLRFHQSAGIETLDEWPNVKAWMSRFLERESVQAVISK